MQPSQHARSTRDRPLHGPPPSPRPVSREESALGPKVEGFESLKQLHHAAHTRIDTLFQKLPRGLIEGLGAPFVASNGKKRSQEEQRRCSIAYALVGISVVNTFAPVWGPALAKQAQHPMADGLHQLHAVLTQLASAESAQGPLQMRLAVLEGAKQVRAPEIGNSIAAAREKAIGVDNALIALDQALSMPNGTSKTVSVEAALTTLGVDSALAKNLAHLSRQSEHASAALATFADDLANGSLNLKDKSEAVVTVLDKVLTDKALTLAFVAGYAMVPAPVQNSVQGAVSVGRVFARAKARHDSAVSTLKAADTNNVAVDAVVRGVGEAIDAATFALLFVGPIPLTKVAKGSDLLLIASEMVAAKTAVKSTQKALAAFSDLPEAVAAFALGTTAAAHVRSEAKTVGLEANAVHTQVGDLVTGLSGATHQRDPHLALQAIEDAWEAMTPHERQVLQHLLRAGAEKLATGS